MAKVDLTGPIIQSPYAYLQAAGSDGADRTVPGIHLRWDFLRSLGDKHFAKGDYTAREPYQSVLGFNRPGDYIKIYRTAFINNYYAVVAFEPKLTKEIRKENLRQWKYNAPVNGLKGVNVAITIRFTDHNQYDLLRAAQIALNPLQLLNRYTGIVEVATDDQLAFYVSYDVKFSKAEANIALRKQKEVIIEDKRVVNSGCLRVEAVTLSDTSDPAGKQVACRKKFLNGTSPAVACENIQYTRFDYVNANWKAIQIYCYKPYIEGINAATATTRGKEDTRTGGWDLVGNFALTTDDAVKDNRFMPAKVDGNEGHWPKFNNDDPLTGAFTVSKTNYNERWRKTGFVFNPVAEANNDHNGLQHFIHTYLKLSKTDERALAGIGSDTPGDLTTQDISYVDMMRLMSLDYHIARILGLGHIDTHTLARQRYVYCFEYKTFAGLEAPHTDAAERTHLYMTSLVSTADHKLPAAPALLPLTFGISVDNGTAQPTLLTDQQGYAPFGAIRFININRAPYKFEKPFGPFYAEPAEYCVCDETQPIAYGLEYKEISEAAYRKPAISSDKDYPDVAGLPETVPILEGGRPTIFTHQEAEEGLHEYKAYAINWFSRVSPLSNSVSANTVFPKKANLLPPFNFAVQLIQDEDPAEALIQDKALTLTTQAEQQLLSNIPGTQDRTLVRVTFDWNHVHHHAHQYADYAELFFRRQEPMVVKGEILAVDDSLPGNRSRITVTFYVNTSTAPPTTITPVILPGDTARFAGSFFNNGQDNYVIESVSSGGVYPVFIVKQIKKVTASADPANTGSFISNETFQSPGVNEHFFVIENMGDIPNWDLKHNKQVYLEKFYTNARVTLRFSATRTVSFDIRSVYLSAGNTVIEVVQPIATGLSAALTLNYSVKHKIIAVAANQFIINGNYTADFTSGTAFRVFGSRDNDRIYTINSGAAAGGTTIITVNEPVSNGINAGGLIEITVSRNLATIDPASNSFELAGNKMMEIDFAHCENRIENDGTVSRFVVGGINDTVSFVPLLTQGPGANIEGTGFIQLNFQNYDLLPHPDGDVAWYKGVVRLKDVSGKMQVYPVTYIGNLTANTPPHLAIVIQDPGFIRIEASQTSPAEDIYTLKLDEPQEANYHPSYKLYLGAASGLHPVTGLPLAANAINFDSNELLPVVTDSNEGSRQTYMAIRSYDIKNDHQSFLSNPVVLLAQKIALPVAPHQPTGPLYATRPDYYGKSTYTFDTRLATAGRIPYSVVFYKTSEDRLLDTLYTKATQSQLWDALHALTDPKAMYDPFLWEILFSGQNNGANFATYTTTAGSFTWPLPDNPDFYIPYQSNLPLGTTNPPPNGYYVFPFRAFNNADTSGTSIDFRLDQSFNIYGKLMSGKAILQSAVQDAFMPLNEQPPIFNYLKEGMQTSATKPALRDPSGNLADPLTADLFPMIRKYTAGNETYLRYTDFTLDGASKSLYFYRALEMDDKFKFSEPSLPVGPVMMVNTFPPHKPQIKKIIAGLQNNAANIPASILFEVNQYLENEKITKLEIYRALDEDDALSIRTMKKAGSINWGNPVIDDFSDLNFPPYGEALYYRLVAIREVEDVNDVVLSPPQLPGDPVPTLMIDFPSMPSEVTITRIADVVNPEPPAITSAAPLQPGQVILNWPPTCYNGTYYLQKLNANGNWVQLYQIRTKESAMQYPPPGSDNMPDFVNFPGTQNLLSADANGNTIYHHFRVQVQNSSGLFNLNELELTL